MNGTRETPSYRLRPQVRAQEKNGAHFLLSTFPLKAMILHASWKPVFEGLTRGGWVPLEEISSGMTGDPRKVECFLEDLVRKGYLEQQGLPSLFELPMVSVIVPVRNREVEIADGDAHFRFRCENFSEFARCMKMFIKEPGTCDWINTQVETGGP